MTKTYLANYCMDNPEHPMFREADGARCVECNGLVNVKEVTASEHYVLPTYQRLRNRYKSQTKHTKAYHHAGITNIISALNYDRSGFHSLTIDISFNHNGKGFEAVGKAYDELVADIHELLLKSKGNIELPTHLEGSD